MRQRRAMLLTLAAAIGLIALGVICAGADLAVHAGLAPALDIQIPTGSYQVLLIHNGPTVSCAPLGLRDSCAHKLVRYEFYIQYITQSTSRVLIWFPTHTP